MKGPFKSHSETEWMWVEAMRWDGNVITGTLQNDPQIVSSLKAGATVTVSLDDAFDYLLVHADGTTEGNQTGELMRRRQQK